MQFFEQQRLCKQNTRILIVLFAITVVITAICTGAVVYFVFQKSQQTSMPMDLGVWYNSNFFIVPAFASALFVLIASVYKSSLNTTGRGIALSVGAKIVPSTTKNPLHRRYLNTVEEMSIASGVPIPLVFVQENENSINAFAAGTGLKNSVICVTDGALKKLTRDELQAVIAHEFSHILNGDMLLNIKLMGYIFGLTFISNTGYRLLRGSRYSSSRNNNSNQVALFALGIVVVGYLGVFLATIIKSIISQQREFLADASSVQFTRNPGAVVNIFKKLFVGHSGVISNPEAVEINHMYFAEATSSFMLSTHPPLIKRIQAIQPNISHKQLTLESQGIAKSIVSTQKRNSDLEDSFQDKEKRIEIQESDTIKNLAGLIITNEWIENNVGRINDDSIDYAESVSRLIPETIKSQLTDSSACQNLILQILQHHSPKVEPKAHLSIIKQAACQLKSLPLLEREAFIQAVEKQINLDQKITKNEIIIYLYVKEILLEPPAAKSKYADSLSALLSFLLNFHDGDDHTDYYQKISSKYYNSQLPPPVSTTIIKIETALNHLKGTSINKKETLLKACVEIIIADDKVKLGEYESLQLICEILEIPLPPITPTHIDRQ